MRLFKFELILHIGVTKNSWKFMGSIAMGIKLMFRSMLYGSGSTFAACVAFELET